MRSTPDRPDGATWEQWGIDPQWSRLVEVAGHDGETRRWHVLDTGDTAPSTGTDTDRPTGATIVCVHGNPTWAYAWKTFLRRFAGRHRVIAVDQLGMGYSERTGRRRYVDRIRDLDDVIGALDIDGDRPLVLCAHDWGGAIAMGWAVDNPERVDAMVLCNTGIGVPEGRGAPRIIELAASAPLRDLVCRRTNAFVEGTVRLSGGRISATDRTAFRAPYRRRDHREAIADFVGDIPLRETDPPHPSGAPLADVADRLVSVEAPVLLAWGARDIVFDDDFADDLASRFPNPTLQRFADANHLVMAEADVASVVDDWLVEALGDDDEGRPLRPPAPATDSVFTGIDRHRDDAERLAVADLADDDRITTAEFARRVDGVARHLVAHGLRRGDRVAMLTPPGVDLIVAVYGVWRAGGVTVVADRGLGLGGLGAAVRSARVDWTIGPTTARMASTLLRWAPRSTHLDVAALMESSEAATGELPEEPGADTPAAVLFTSGATGPAKGVRYTHGQLAAQRDALARVYGIGDDDRMVAAFAPFALYGPALGIPTALTDCDVTTPGELTFRSLGTACDAVDATLAFASPSALSNVVATAPASGRPLDSSLSSLRLVLSAGAPVPSETLRAVATLATSAEIHTPYGMTEALPVADIDLAGIEAAESPAPDAGVCVGRPVEGAEVRIVALDFDALDGVPDHIGSDRLGEILVRAPWVSDGYLGRWQSQRLARPGAGWHRTGDVGRLDAEGRLWVDGRSVHVVRTADGVIAPVPVERDVERALSVDGRVTPGRVAAVGVGPAGCQQVVVVIESHLPEGLAPDELAHAVRSTVRVPVAAVLCVHSLPVDIRHAAKIDRTAVAAHAAGVLSGESGGASRGVLRRALSRLRRR